MHTHVHMQTNTQHTPDQKKYQTIKKYLTHTGIVSAQLTGASTIQLKKPLLNCWSEIKKVIVMACPFTVGLSKLIVNKIKCSFK